MRQEAERKADMSEQTSGRYISVSERLTQFKSGSVKTVKHYPTGIQKLDKTLGGGLYAGLTFLGARPGMGKSTFALQIASEIAAGGFPVLFYSLEMPAIRMEAKILNRAIHMRYPDNSITADWFLREENMQPKNKGNWLLAEKVEREISDDYKNLYIREREKISFSGQDIIQDTELFMKEKKKKPVVFVDYLQILSSSSGNRNATERQKNDENINALSSLSNKHGLAVFVISSLNRESYKDTQRPLRMDSFKETGGIEYSASVILGMQPRNIHQPRFNYEMEMSKEARELEIVFLKQRYGVSGIRANVNVDFYAAKDLYVEKGVSGRKNTAAEKQEQDVIPEKTKDQSSGQKISSKQSQNDDGTQVTKISENVPESPETETDETENTASGKKELEYPDDPRERLAEAFRRFQ